MENWALMKRRHEIPVTENQSIIIIQTIRRKEGRKRFRGEKLSNPFFWQKMIWQKSSKRERGPVSADARIKGAERGPLRSNLLRKSMIHELWNRRHRSLFFLYCWQFFCLWTACKRRRTFFADNKNQFWQISFPMNEPGQSFQRLADVSDQAVSRLPVGRSGRGPRPDAPGPAEDAAPDDQWVGQ